MARAVRITRQAISPRLAIRIFLNITRCSMRLIVGWRRRLSTALRETATFGKFFRSTRQFPAGYMMKPGRDDHAHETVEIGHPPIGVVIAVFIADIEFHDDLRPGIALAQSATKDAVIVEYRRLDA